MPKPMPSQPQQKIRHIAGLVAWFVVLAVLPFVANSCWNNPGVLLSLAGIYLAIALVLRSRLIMGVLAGILLGLLFYNGVQGGSRVSQVWGTVGNLAVGLMIGIVAGLVWEGAAVADADGPTRPKSKRRR